MWHNFDWAWGMGAHMLLWWSIMLIALLTIAGLIFLLAGMEYEPDESAHGNAKRREAVKPASPRAPA